MASITLLVSDGELAMLLYLTISACLLMYGAKSIHYHVTVMYVYFSSPSYSPSVSITNFTMSIMEIS